MLPALTALKISGSGDSRLFECRRGTIFTFLWGIYVLLQDAMTQEYNRPPEVHALIASLAVGLTALLVVSAPGDLTRFAALLVATTALVFVRMPFIPNHIFFTFSVSVTTLAALAGGHSRRGRSAMLESMEQSMALIRCEVLIMYFFVVFHKINYDYFDAHVSCSVAMYRDIEALLRFKLPGAWTEASTIWGVIVVEALIPFLLAIPRTRVLGVTIGLIFHYLLSLHPDRFVYDYSSMMFALFALFLPDDFLANICAMVKRISIRRLTGIIVLGVLAEACVFHSGLVVDPAKLDDSILIWFRFVWMALGFTAIAIYGATLFGRFGAEWRRLALGPEFREPSYFRPAVSWLLIFPAILFINGLCPYIGLKTQSAFAMFSNLRTEGGKTNHMFMPIRFRLGHFQEDLAEIIDSSDAAIRSLHKPGYCVPFFELRRNASSLAAADLTVTYIRGGQRITASRLTNPTAEVFQKLPRVSRKLLFFRPVQLGSEPQKCCW